MSAKRQKRYWLMKSETDVYPLEQLRKDGSAEWTGVRNYEARNLMRDEMRIGDGVLFYHSNVEPSQVVGIAEVCSEPHPDPTQFDKKSEYYDPKSTKEQPRWMLVDIKYVEAFERPVTLAQIKTAKGLENMALIRRGRLSVQPVTPEEWEIVLRLGRA
jgi:predicted RNA-binding protein with PUA-like domain